MFSVPVVRLVAQVFASVGVSKVVNDVIRNNTTIVTTADAVRVWAGSVVIGSMIADNAARHVDARVNEIVEWRRKQQETAAE
jgi:hypothetical protein